MLDQASKLREIIKTTRVYSLVSPIEGAEKTNFALKLGREFKKMGKSVILLNEESNYRDGFLGFNNYGEDQKNKTIESLLNLNDYEIVIIDNIVGLNQDTLNFINFSHETILLTQPGDTYIIESYRLLKTISQKAIKEKIKVYVNTENKIDDSFYRLNQTTNRFLKIKLEDISNIPSENLAKMLYGPNTYNRNQMKEKIIELFNK